MAPVVAVIRESPVSRLFPFSRGELRTLVRAMLMAAGVEEGVLEIALLDDAEMAALNASALGLTGPTNVLSFPEGGAGAPGSSADDGPSAFGRPFCRERQKLYVGPSLGRLAVAPETLLRECLLYGQEPEEHAVRLLAHGLAHLLGHDHGPAMDALCRKLETAATSLFAEAV